MGLRPQFIPDRRTYVVALLAPLMFVVIGAMFFKEGWRGRRIALHRRTVNAVLVDWRHESRGNGYFARYRFQVPGGTTYSYHGLFGGTDSSAQVDADALERAKATKRLLVEYDATDPGNNRPVRHNDGDPSTDLVVGAGFWGIAATLWFVLIASPKIWPKPAAEAAARGARA